MKLSFLHAFLASCLAAGAQEGFQPVLRTPDSTTWRRVTFETNTAGQVWARTNEFVQLETGLQRQVGADKTWVASREEIELAPNGAIARRGPYQATFAANINSPVSAEVLTPDHKRLRFRILGMAYFDFHTRSNVLIAELKDSIGELVATNQILWRDAFTDFRADVRLTYRKSGLEQDVILRQRPPLPEEFGLHPATTRLLLFTEFFDPPADVRQESRVRRGWRRDQVTKIVDFGRMKIGQGAAFALGAGAAKRAPVEKHWLVLGRNRTFLVEEVSFSKITAQLANLQARSPATSSSGPAPELRRSPARELELPEPRLAVRSVPAASIQVARSNFEEGGVVLDWNLQSGTDVTLCADTTYLVTGKTILGGTARIESAVVKYAPGASLEILGSIECDTGAGYPAIFTALDDDTVGVMIPGSTGSPSGWYAEEALALHNGGELRYVHIRHARTGVRSMGGDYRILHSQFVRCQSGLVTDTGNFYAGNLLMSRVWTNFAGSRYHGTVEHLTSDQADRVAEDPDFSYEASCGGQPTSSLWLVNSIVRAATNGWGIPAVQSLQVACFSAAEWPFVTAGAGDYYLPWDSSCLGAGSPLIGAGLAADLKALTTQPPLVLTNLSYSNQTHPVWRPRALRDGGAPALGYHYTALDYLCSEVAIHNDTLNLARGTAVGLFGSHGFSLSGGGGVRSEGRAERLNRLLWYSAVQESPRKLHGISPASGAVAVSGASGNSANHIALKFTEFSGQGARQPLFDAAVAWPSLSMSDSVLRAAAAVWPTASGANTVSIDIRNCDLERSTVALTRGPGAGISSGPVSFQNNLLRGGGLALVAYDPHPQWTVRDNLFDASSIVVTDACLDKGCNAFRASAPGGLSDSLNVTLTELIYGAGPFGNRYIQSARSAQSSAALINAGSRSAAAAGLFHHTLRTDQQKEGADTPDIVDIGFHLVACAGGLPIDSDGDGAPDYLEDANGNGGLDDATRWDVYDSPNGLAPGSGLQVFTPLKK